MNQSHCICGSGKPFEKCCQRFLSGAEQAKTAEQLMRSRYSAYALGGHGDYLLKTWFPATAANLDPIELSQRSQNWQRLEILDKSQKGDDATVEFNAYYLIENSDQLKVMHEVSQFKRVAGRWLYVGGVVNTTH